MTDTIPPWLATMREITGTLEAPGDEIDNPVILGWRDAIAARFPDMKGYCAGYQHDVTPWCGLTMAYCMAHNGIRPVFGTTDTDKFLWAEAWKQFGTPVDKPVPGDILVFRRHVTMFEEDDGDTYLCRGGNQHDAVRTTNFKKGGCIAIRRPPAPTSPVVSSEAIAAGAKGRRFAAVTATVFGGAADPNTSAYDGHIIDDDELGVALPARLKGRRPRVRVFRGNRSVECDVVDIGPWNTDDPYWEGGDRPQAECGTDRRGRKTNLAGIDLTPAAAEALGLDGRGKVDWEFVGDVVVVKPTEPDKPQVIPTLPHLDEVITALARRLDRLDQILDVLRGRAARATDTPVPTAGGTAGTTTSGGTTTPAPANATEAVIQLIALLEKLRPPRADGAPPVKLDEERLRKILDAVQLLLGGKLDGAADKLGPVNGALGQTIGQLLNGRKTALGIGGSLITALLAGVPAGSGLGQVLALLTPASGLAQFALPIFLAMTAWGTLGKLEKWSGNSGDSAGK